MPTIAERLQNLGVRQAEKVWGRTIKNLRTGLAMVGEFEEIDPLVLTGDSGTDEREGNWFHFLRPLPDIVPSDRLQDQEGNIWEVLTGYENHPYRPRAKVKVQKIIGKDS